MKFDCARDPISLCNENYIFHFSLSENEVRKVIHKYGWEIEQFNRSIGPGIHQNVKISTAISAIRDVFIAECYPQSESIDLGIDYKGKYEELVDLLGPYKIDNMPPETTLKMLLKYNK
jgi:hypothetical protein